MSRSLSLHSIRRLALLVALLALGPAAAAEAASSPSSATGIATLNALRARVGVQPVVHDSAQSAGCRRHAAYYRLTGHIGHEELPGDPGYTRRGDQAAQTSNLVYSEGAFSGAADWVEAVYHRIAMFHPRLADSGYWAENDIACLGVLGTMSGPTVKQLTAYPYPADGQQGVPVKFGCNERPSPCAAVRGASRTRPVGSILSLQFDAPQDSVDATVVESATLTPDGATVPVPAVVQDENSRAIAPYLRGGMALIPRAPLALSTWYTARITGTVAVSDAGDGALELPFDVSWRFQTGPVVLSAASSSKRCSPTRKAVTRSVKRCKTAKKKAANKNSRRSQRG